MPSTTEQLRAAYRTECMAKSRKTRKAAGLYSAAHWYHLENCRRRAMPRGKRARRALEL
ncbi:hypothetical protein D3C80_1557930 [compost metagenome]